MSRRSAYRGRNVIERGDSDVKQWRGLATRYDKLGLTSSAGAVLRAIIQWLQRLDQASIPVRAPRRADG
ncbi:hypothetical protein GCM10011490_16510 [Pseudoclavibacter endophyticus]|uniref:hypothetical protein n=1 Tax=Pseudoclavibacter endophyticus TaxID=1778590 RepID=UPI0019B6313B|nr:hypothetical protein GCM10011490_16510 [Pseudoclavibacter endophyticus]